MDLQEEQAGGVDLAVSRPFPTVHRERAGAAGGKLQWKRRAAVR